MSEMNSSGVVPKGSTPLVFWDGYGLANSHSGIAFYAISLYDSLRKLNVDPVIIAPEKPFFGEHSLVLPVKFPRKIRTSKLVWPATSYKAAEKHAASAGCPAVFHGLSNINAPITRRKSGLPIVVTVHDMTPLLAPEMVSRSYYLQFAFAMKRIVPLVDRIVADSAWTAQTIRERFPEASSKVTVISLGRPDTFAPCSDWTPGRSISVLTVSRFERYKNLEIIAKIAKKVAGSITFDLVSDQNAENFFRANYRELLETGSITLHRNVDEQTLDRLFARTDCYFQPSFYEGFCLPVMKAISKAVPIAFLKGSAVDEIALSEFSCGVDRNLVEDFVEAIHLAVNKREKSDFIEKVRTSFMQFPTWDLAAQKLKTLYTSLNP